MRNIAKINFWEKQIDIMLRFKTAQIIVIIWLERKIFDGRGMLTLLSETVLEVINKVQSVRS